MKNITKIANIVILAILLGLSVYQNNRISSLGNEVRGIKMEIESASSRIDSQVELRHGTNTIISILQKKAFSNEIFEAKKILSKKLKIEEDRILFEDFKYSVSGEEVIGIGLIISGACDVDMYSCASFTVDIETGVISKF